MKNHARNAKKTSLYTTVSVKIALLGQKLKRLLTYQRRKLQNVRSSILAFLFEAAGVEPGKKVELAIILVVSFLLAIACSWAILTLVADLPRIVR